LHEGRILAAGPLEELREKYQKDSLQDIFPAVLRQPQTPPPPVSFPEIGNSREPETASIRPQPGPFRKMMAFLRRDFRSEFSYRLSFFLQFFHVFFSVAVFYFIAQMIGEADIPQLEPYGGDYFPFVLLGIALSGYVGVGLSSFSRGIRKAQTTGTLEAMLSTPTRLSTIVISSSLWSYLLTTFRVLVYLILGALFLGAEFTLQGWGWAGLILLLTIVSLSSLGIVAASFIMVLKKGDPVTWAFGALTNLLGGIYYPVEILPRWLQFFSALLPVTYSLRGMRRALLQGGGFPVLKMDLAALVGFSGVLLPLSLAAFRYAVRRAKRDGSLTHY
jgi:ABC-2 type transport system permease protein